MGIISVLFLVFGWIFSVKGLIITALCLSSFFALCLSMCLFFFDTSSKIKKDSCMWENIIQFIVLILSIVKLTKGF